MWATVNFSSKEDAASIFIQGEAEDCPAPLRVIQDHASLSNDGCVSGEMSKLAGMSFAEIRAQWENVPLDVELLGVKGGVALPEP